MNEEKTYDITEEEIKTDDILEAANEALGDDSEDTEEIEKGSLASLVIGMGVTSALVGAVGFAIKGAVKAYRKAKQNNNEGDEENEDNVVDLRLTRKERFSMLKSAITGKRLSEDNDVSEDETIDEEEK